MQHTRGYSQARAQQTWIQQAHYRLILALVCVFGFMAGVSHTVQAGAPNAALEESQQPIRIQIPAVDINAPIESVGQDEDGLMVAPSKVESVAWYNLGPIPGESGNAVMAGHLDNYRGRPAVFWRLDELVAGDEIIVQYSDESEKRFEVLSVESYDADDAPLPRIFGIDIERDLNLITCDGKWNKQNKLYDKRLVVYSRLINEPTAPTESNAPSTLPAAPPTRTTHARQNRQ